jgi:sugar lactone lactonase YvrE
MPQPRAYHGIVFDADNNLVGNDTTHIHSASDPENAEVWLPGVGTYEQIGLLADGDIVAISGTNGTVERIASDGSRIVLYAGLDAYGLVVGPDNMVYIADPWISNTIIRIDPDTGWAEEYISGFDPNVYGKVMTFNRDYSRMYIGTRSDTGAVLFVDLDQDLEPVGGLQLFAVDAGTWHDGIGMDACGNLYVNDYSRTRLNRISQKGKVSVYHDFPSFDYGHGHTWGTGVGSWDDHTLYVPQPYIGYRVAALTIGVPAMDWNDGIYITINE